MPGDTVPIRCRNCGNEGEVPEWWPDNIAECKQCGETFLVEEVSVDGE